MKLKFWERKAKSSHGMAGASPKPIKASVRTLLEARRMNLATQIERDLYNYLSPAGKAKVEKHYAALEAEDADESAELMVRPDFVPDEDRLRDQEQDR